jgi:hypothetical protein
VNLASDLHALAVERLLEVYKKEPESVKKIVQDYLKIQ